jgi:AcrR family transcriptional regulator
MPRSKKQCEEIKEGTRKQIIEKSILYFSKNGFSGTKMSDLCQYIGIAQGSIYNYFGSKEELFEEIRNIVTSFDLEPVRKLVKLPISPKKKIKMLSKEMIKKLEEDQLFVAAMTIGTQELLENPGNRQKNAAYESELYQLLGILVEQGQREKKIVEGEVMKLVDLYWGTVYLYALKKMFSENYIMIDADDLNRILIK